MFVQSKKRCIAQAEQIYTQAIEAYIARDFDKAAQLFKQTFDLDPLNPIYGLNTGFAFYEWKKYDEAIRYFDLSITLKKGTIVEIDLRFKKLSLYQAGRSPESCTVFLKLKNQFPKRMYDQDFQKYCLGKNVN